MKNATFSQKTIERLKKLVDYEGDCECVVERKSKYGITASLISGLCLIAKFKINVRTGKFTRVI